MLEDRVESQSDGSLLRRVRGGEDDAATALYLRYAGRLRALTASQASPDLQRRVDPDDIVQSVFRTFFRRAAKGDYDLPDGDELWKLFLVIGLNKVRALGAYHKAAKRDVRQTQDGGAFDAAMQTAVCGDDASLQVLKMTIDELLTPLPAEYRQIVDLRVSGCEVAEIAERVKRSRRSVERILQEFRQQLHGIIDDAKHS